MYIYFFFVLSLKDNLETCSTSRCSIIIIIIIIIIREQQL